jgi:signal peptidase II
MASSPDRSEVAARTRRGSFVDKAWFWVPILPMVALDLWSKAAAFGYLEGRFPLHPGGARRVNEFDFLPDPLGFALVDWRNTGTIWGLGRDFTTALIVLRAAALLLLLWLAWRTPAWRRLQLLVLGLIFAGAVGNLYDNLFMQGSGVRDFLLFYYTDGSGQEHHFPAFNVADSCISVGAITLALLMWRQPESDSRSAAPAATTGQEP